MLNVISLLIAAAVAAAPTTELRYAGTLSRLDRRGDAFQVKEFEVTFLDRSEDGNQHRIVYVTTEPGGMAVAWPERFGEISGQFHPPQKIGGPVTVLCTQDDRSHLLSLPDPMFEHRDNLAADAEWSTDAFRYRVLGSQQVEGRDGWEVEVVSTGRGGTYVVVVDPETGRVQSGRRRLTIGQGEAFDLVWRLSATRELPAEESERAAVVSEDLLKLQATLGRTDDGANGVLSPAQLDAAAAALETLTGEAQETPFERLVTAMARDVVNQQKSADSVAELAEKFVGEAAPEFALTGLDGKPIPSSAHAGKTLVLHFWDYRDEPLEEPYGQIGYLDFLLNRHSGEKLAVYGVAVDRRLRDPATASAATRSVRRLKSFMNLGYEIAADRDGTLLKAFGDPTQFDAMLPLWVVIGPDGKVAHYRTGYYEIDRELGLSEIDAIVTRLEE